MVKIQSKFLQVILCFSFIANGALFAGGSEDFQYALALMMEREEYSLAAEKFSDFVKTNSTHSKAPRALYYLAGCYAKMKKDLSAADTYKRIVKVYPAAGEQLLQESLSYGADAYFRSELYEKAANMYGQLLKDYPRSQFAESARFWRGECLGRIAAKNPSKENPNYLAAIKNYDDFLTQFPMSKMRADAMYSAGFCAYDARDYEKAGNYLVIFANEFSSDSRVEEVLYHAADSKYWLGDYETAKEQFARLIKNYPNGKFAANALSGIAWCKYAEKKFIEAGNDFSAAARMYKDKQKAALVHYDAGAAYEEAGDFKSAEREYLQAAHTENHARRGKAYLRLGGIARNVGSKENDKNSVKQAVEYLEKAIEYATTEEDRAEAFVFLGEARLDLKDNKAAADAFNKVVERFPKSSFGAFSLYQLSLAFAEQKQYKEAAGAIRELLKNYPQNQLRLQAAYAMADYQQALGNTKKSRMAYEWIARKGQEWAASYRDSKGAKVPGLKEKARDLAAKSLLRLGESWYSDSEKNNEAVTKAELYFKLLVEKFPDSSRRAAAYLRLGEIAEQKRDCEKAIGNYLQAIKLVELELKGKNSQLINEELEKIVKHSRYRIGVAGVLGAQMQLNAKVKQQEMKRARTELNAFIERYETDKNASSLVNRALYYRAEAKYALKDKESALNDYQACYNNDKKGKLADAALFGLGWTERELGKQQEALVNLQLLVDNFPKSEYVADALYLLALNKRETKQYAAALEDVQQIVNQFSESRFCDKAKIEEAKIYDAMGKSEIAEQKLIAFLKTNKESVDRPQALYALSWVYWNIAEPMFKKAEADKKTYDKFLQGDDERDLIGERKETANALKQEWQETLSSARVEENKMAIILQKLLIGYPGFEFAGSCQLRLGEIAYERGKYKAALKKYQAVINSGDKEIADKAHYRMGWCYLKLAESVITEQGAELTKKALNEFITVCQKYPKSALVGECAWRAAGLLREKEDYNRALVFYQRASKAKNNNQIVEGAIYGMGLCLLEMKDYSSALKQFKDFLNTNPKSTLIHEANWGAGHASLMMGAHEDAKDYFMAAKSNEYGGEAAAKARYGLGLIAFGQQDWKSAREEFRKVDVFHAKWREVAAMSLLKAAQASRNLGENSPAEKDLNRIINNYTNTASYEMAKKEISQLNN